MTYKDPKDQLAQNQRWRAANKESYKKSRRLVRYRYLFGEEAEAVIQALDSPDIRCGICGVREPPTYRGWCIDHNHKTGKIRGVLCRHCNVGGGHFRDDPVLLRKAAEWFGR